MRRAVFLKEQNKHWSPSVWFLAEKNKRTHKKNKMAVTSTSMKMDTDRPWSVQSSTKDHKDRLWHARYLTQARLGSGSFGAALLVCDAAARDEKYADMHDMKDMHATHNVPGR